MTNLKKGDQDSESLALLTDGLTMNRLRESVQPPGKKGTWLRCLSDKHLAEVYQLLRMTISPLKIAKKAQKEWHVMLDSSPKSLARAILQFSNDVIKGDLTSTSAQTPEEKDALWMLRKKGRRILEKFDALGTMRWALDEQATRFALLREREDQLKMPLKMTEKTYKELREGLRDYLEIAIRLGILDAKPSEVSLTLKHTFQGLQDSVLTNDGLKMIEATNELVKRIEGDAVLLSIQEDGSYSVKEDAPIERATVTQK